MKTCRVRRSRPSALALGLALALTMLVVYLASAASGKAPERGARTLSASEVSSAEVRFEGMEADFLAECVCENELDARVAAAKCVQGGGAGLILSDESGYAVIHEVKSGAKGAIRRGAAGLTMRVRGRAADGSAIAGAAVFLRDQAAQTGALADAMESGGTDADAVRTLMQVYRTQGKHIADALDDIEDESEVTRALKSAVNCALERLDSAIRDTTPAKIRLIHAAGCAEWIQLLNTLSELSGN